MKQFGVGSTPFTPANPALDIPNGDPLELKKVTDQSMNAFYSELYNAITKSGQTLTPADGSASNLSQLWTAINRNNFNGATFIDAGGNVGNVRNIKPINSNIILPTTPAEWVGFQFIFSLGADLNWNTAYTINFKNWDGTTAYSATYRPTVTEDPIVAGQYKHAVIMPTGYIQPVFAYPFMNKLYDQNNTVVWRETGKKAGENLMITTGRVTTTTASTTAWNTITLPAAYTRILAISNSCIIDPNSGGNATFINTHAFIQFSDIYLENSVKYMTFSQNGARTLLASFSYQVIGLV